MASRGPHRDPASCGRSSSSSDSDRRPRPPPGYPETQKKKKKKPKAPPQKSVNKIWSRFARKHFNKALAILPFDPVPPPSTPERPNELLSAGYERAAAECRRRVRKITQECRRVNTRYRDAGWDLVGGPRVAAACPPDEMWLTKLWAGLGPEDAKGKLLELPRLQKVPHHPSSTSIRLPRLGTP